MYFGQQHSFESLQWNAKVHDTSQTRGIKTLYYIPKQEQKLVFLQQMMILFEGLRMKGKNLTLHIFEF